MGKSNFTQSRKRRLDSERQWHRSSEFYDPTMRCWQIHYVEEDERFYIKTRQLRRVPTLTWNSPRPAILVFA